MYPARLQNVCLRENIMSLNPRDLTQGGQVAFMRLKMFLQINNLISYYVIMGTVLFGIAVLLMRMSIQNLTNGIIYWFVRVMSPFTEKMVSQPVYTIRYYEHNLQYSARQVLSDSYTLYGNGGRPHRHCLPAGYALTEHGRTLCIPPVCAGQRL